MNPENQITLGIQVILTIQAIQVRVANCKMSAWTLAWPRLNLCPLATIGQKTIDDATTSLGAPPLLVQVAVLLRDGLRTRSALLLCCFGRDLSECTGGGRSCLQ
jgi:hypothetical protein